MAVATQAELMLALERGQYDLVLGTSESNVLDFKEAPYLLREAHQKWELAKDVAALANSQGGTIVVGYRTERPANALVDQASTHRPVPKASVNWDALRQTIASWVYPPVQGLAAFWFPADATADAGVFVIEVPPQAEADKYFVVRELDRPDGAFPGAVDVPCRQADAVSWQRPEAIHHLLREALAGRRAGTVLAPTAAREVLVVEERRVQHRATSMEAAAGWAEVPWIAFHALPSRLVQRPDDFYAPGPLRQALERPDVLREHGFHLRTEVDATVQRDGSLAVITDRRLLWLSPDGYFSAAGRADSEFFGWHVNPGAERPIALNTRVLTEFTLEFARLFHARVKLLSNGAWSLWLSLVGLDRDGGVVLVPLIGRGGDFIQFWRARPWERHVPLQPTMHRRVDSAERPGDDAYRLLLELYACFGAPPTELPFVDNATVSEPRLLEGMRR